MDAPRGLRCRSDRPELVERAPGTQGDAAQGGGAGAADSDDEVVPGAKPALRTADLMRICEHCGTPNAASRRFCLKCGKQLPEGEVIPPRICPNCSTPNNPARRFCMKCGTSLVETAPPPTDKDPWWKR